MSRDPIQSALHPAGLVAQEISELTWLLVIGGVVIFVIVMALTAAGLLFARGDRPRSQRLLLVGGGFAFPAVVLTILTVHETLLGNRIALAPDPALPRIEVVGRMWWWEVGYRDPAGGPLLVTANEIAIPVGRPVEFLLSSPDVIHSFWVPNLAGKMDLIPGRQTRLVLQADRPGVYRGQCAEFCGAQHALMAFYVRALPAAEFDAWLANQREPAREPDIALLATGRDLFVAGGCGSCHVVRGLAGAEGELGPDLTHLGSRLSLGAGILDNHQGTLAAWIVSSQHLKPENRMPSFDQFTGEQLRALAAYLASLE